MDNKMLKPKSCLNCEVVEKSKSKIVCGCLRTLSADILSSEELKIMYKFCPLKWDKE